MTRFKVDIPDNEIASFKEYLEKIGGEFEETFELSVEYKKEMDELLQKHQEGKLEYLTESEFRMQSSSK